MSGGTTLETGDSVATIAGAIGRSGYCVVPEVIPPVKVGQVRQEVVAAQRAQQQAAAAELAKTRARGHRVGAAGVDNLRQVINATQCFAAYLADQRILGTTGALFGDFVRISCTDCVITNPGSERGYWHADWPYNATNSTHVKAPYPDALMHLSGIWMLTDFSSANGGTFIIPGSHRHTDNPAGETLGGFDRDGPHPQQLQVTGSAGSVLLYDSRLWHAVAPNVSSEARVALIIRFAPWWLNLTPTIRGTPDHERMVAATGGKNYDAVPIVRDVFDRLPPAVQPLYQHFVTN
jgi:ectoine hydroxylase-related dioxygenase (phytanoyl-CoA dioxygenase family)